MLKVRDRKASQKILHSRWRICNLFADRFISKIQTSQTCFEQMYFSQCRASSVSEIKSIKHRWSSWRGSTLSKYICPKLLNSFKNPSFKRIPFKDFKVLKNYLPGMSRSLSKRSILILRNKPVCCSGLQQQGRSSKLFTTGQQNNEKFVKIHRKHFNPGGQFWSFAIVFNIQEQYMC